jgi:hypothetical protein
VQKISREIFSYFGKPLSRIGFSLILIFAAAGIGYTLTSASSFGEKFYSPEVQLISVVLIALVAPFVIYSGMKQALWRRVIWSYLIGAKLGGFTGLFIGVMLTGATIYYRAMWIMSEKKLIAGAFILGGISGLLTGAVVGLIMLPLARIVFGYLQSQ